MPEREKRRRRSTRRSGSGEPQFGSNFKVPSQPILVTATDICLWLTMIAVTIGFGGRFAIGQVALVVGSSLMAFFWMLHQFTSSERRYAWTGSEWLWCLGILVSLAQLVPLSDDLLLKISPHIKDILPIRFDGQFPDLFPARWTQLSLAPWETASGLALFVSYALFFLVAAQRLRTVKDVEYMLCAVGLAAVAMMVFAQFQFFTSNGKFFWVFDHPHMTTETYPLGCFSNRNHLSQFLTLGAAPLLWWLLRRLHQQELDLADRKGMPKTMHSIIVGLLLASLAGIALTVLMTLSRGGFLAISLSTCVAVGLMYRIGLVSIKFASALMLVGLVTGCLFSYSKYESILASKLEQKTGRQEIWLANIAVARQFPILGTGIGTHADAYQLHIESELDDDLEYSHAECGYLQIASESGVAGLTVAILMIATSLWWCIGSFWNTDTKATAAAAAILASLIANIVHAVVDFFWYTPLCVMMLSLQLACAARLYRLTRQEAGRFAFSLPLPRIVTAMGMCGLVPVALWMFDLRWPAALAEPHRIEAMILSKADTDGFTEEEERASNEKRIRETLLAAKLDRRDAKLQEAAGDAYAELFDLKQQDTDTMMSSNMIRDTVKVSEFEDADAARKWMKVAIGDNLKFLSLAARSLKRSLADSPLRAKSYVLLTEINFIDGKTDPVFQESCLTQALTLRPRDTNTMYLVGKACLEDGDLQKAMAQWRPAFERGLRAKEQIAKILAAQMTPEYFLEEFHPDWKDLAIITDAFAKSNRVYEARQMQRKYIRATIEHAKILDVGTELELMLISARNTCRNLGDLDAAAAVMRYAVKRLPQSYSVRYMLSLDLVESDHAAEAAEHLKWCTNRNPNDPNLRRFAEKAVTARLKQTSADERHHRDSDRSDPR